MYYDEEYSQGCIDVSKASGGGGAVPVERQYGVKAVIATRGGYLTLTGYDKIQSFEIVTDLLSEDYITYGNACSKQLTLNLINCSDLKNTNYLPQEKDSIKLYLYVDDGTIEDHTAVTNVMPLGTYYISNVEKNNREFSKITITAFDLMSHDLMNAPWYSKTPVITTAEFEGNDTDYFDPKVYTAFLLDVEKTIHSEIYDTNLSLILPYKKIQLGNEYLPQVYMDKVITAEGIVDDSFMQTYKAYVTNKISRRQMIAYLAGLCGCNAYIDYSDNLRFTSFVNVTNVSSPAITDTVMIYPDDCISFTQTDDPQYPSLVQVVTYAPSDENGAPKIMQSYYNAWTYTDSDGNEKEVSGDKTMQYNCPFAYFRGAELDSDIGLETGNTIERKEIDYNVAEKARTYITAALTTKDNQKYRIKPCEIKWRGNPIVECGDVLLYQDNTDNEMFSIPVCHITMKYAGGFTMSIKSFGFALKSTETALDSQGVKYDTVTQTASVNLLKTQTLITRNITDIEDGQVLLTKNSNGNTVLGWGRMKSEEETGGQTNIYGKQVNVSGLNSVSLRFLKSKEKPNVFASVDFDLDSNSQLFFRPGNANTDDSTDGVNLGSGGHRWRCMYSNYLNTLNFSGTDETATVTINYEYTDTNKNKVSDSGYIRYYADTSGNEIVRPSRNEKIYLGSNNYRWYRVYTKSIYCTDGKFATSDRKAKEDINAIDGSFKDFVMSLKPVTYKLKKGTGKRTHCGFVAQDVSQAAKDTVGDLALYRAETKDGKKYNSSIDDSELEWVLDYEELIAPLTALVQQQQKQIDKLTEEIEKLKQQ